MKIATIYCTEYTVQHQSDNSHAHYEKTGDKWAPPKWISWLTLRYRGYYILEASFDD